MSQEFYPEAFTYDPSTDRYTCPAGKLLSFETEERQSGWVKRRYRARAAVPELSVSGSLLSRE